MENNANFQRLIEELVELGDEAAPKATNDAAYLQFLEAFPAQRLTALSLADYCVGKGGSSSFCWWLERGLQPVLGRYMPGTSRGHILYFLKDGTVYKHRRLKDLSDQAALEYTLRIQAAIAQADANQDLRWIDDDEQIFQRAGVEDRITVGNGRKLRLLSCYHPDDTIPISSSAHLRHFLEVLGVPSTEIPPEDQPVGRMMRLREVLSVVRRSLPNVSSIGFMRALYSDRLGLAPAKDRDQADDTLADDARPAPPNKIGAGVAAASSVPLNQILYGPPGTGKTFATIDAALEILDPAFWLQNLADRKALKERYDQFAKERRVRFVTFHQSFSYEDFVEGLRAQTNEDQQLEYAVEPGVFKQICDDAKPTVVAGSVTVPPNARIWKISINGTGDSSTKNYCLMHDEARIGWGGTGDLRNNPEGSEYYQDLGKGDHGTLRYFSDEISIGDVLICIQSAYEIAAVGVVTGDYRFESERDVPSGVIDDYQHVRPVKWLYKGLSIPVGPLNAGKGFTLKTVYQMNRLTWADLSSYLESHGANPISNQLMASAPSLPYVLVIDEINRGNISRIFGELITLIESSKRSGAPEWLEVTLPYSKAPFSVPRNVYLIGTMNTADRSLTALDVALRRRFSFKEMAPRPSLLEKVRVGNVPIDKLMTVMNQRIEALLDREHCLGHALFMPLRDDRRVEKLADIFRHNILPLLQEYFYDDWQRIQWVLNDHRKTDDAYKFVVSRKVDSKALFGEDVNIGRSAQLWRINEDAFPIEQSYLGILGDEDIKE